MDNLCFFYNPVRDDLIIARHGSAGKIGQQLFKSRQGRSYFSHE